MEQNRRNKGENKMDAKKLNGKAITGIAMAAIMLASVMVAMVPTATALPLPDTSYNGLYHDINLTVNPGEAVPVLIGQYLWLHNLSYSGATIQGDPTASDVAGEIFTADSDGKFDTTLMTKTGIYYVNQVGGTSTASPTYWEAKLAVTKPLMTLKLKVGGDEVSSITEETLLEIDFATTLGPKDMVSLVIIDPDGDTIKDADGQLFDKINVSWIRTQYGVGAGIDTSDWKLGTYKFKVVTKKDAPYGARGLDDEPSNVKTLQIIKSDICIEADKTSVAELERVELTVTGVAGNYISITTSDPEHTTFPEGVNNNKITIDGVMNDKIDADGVRTYAVEFNDTGSYTITVKDFGKDATRSPANLVDDDDLDITVSEKDVTFDMPTTVVIGENLTIRGTSNTGDWVQIAVEDIICDELKKLVIDENGEFEEEIDTATACDGAFSDPGSVRLKAFIDTTFPSGYDVSGRTGDGSAKVFILNNAGGGIDISASKVNIDKNETIILTIEAVPGHNVSVTTADTAQTVFEYNRYDFKGTSNNIINIAPADTISIPADIGDCDSQADAMNIHGVWKKMDEDGIRKFEVHFTDIGTYKISATDYGTAYPTATRLDEEDIEITVSAKNVTFDVSPIVAIGERLTVRGTSNTGDWVQIAVDDIICDKIKKLVIDENGEFEKVIDTSTACAGAFAVPGYVRLKAFIDTAYASGEDVSKKTDDGSTKLFMVGPWLTASLSTDSVDSDDEFTISGTAKGSKEVNILIVAPKGSSGSVISGSSGDKMINTRPDGTTEKTNIYYKTTSVSTTDDTFEKKIDVGDDVDTGSYLVILITPGPDGKYGKYGDDKLVSSVDAALAPYYFAAKTQEEVLAIIEDAIALSDDLLWLDYVKVGKIETLTLNPIGNVVVGNSLEVTGATSRKDGSIIWITVKKPYYEIVPQAATVKDNTFNATFDTTGVQLGTYVVKAIDEYGYTAATTADIIAETPA